MAARKVEGMMSEKMYDVSADWTKRAWVDNAKYREMYARSVSDPTRLSLCASAQ
jgi:acetyl-CoA synthetase